MTVQELINELEKIEDKDQDVFVFIKDVRGQYLISEADENILSAIWWGIH